MAEKDFEMPITESDCNKNVQVQQVNLADGKIPEIIVDDKGSTSDPNISTDLTEGDADVYIVNDNSDEQEFKLMPQHIRQKSKSFYCPKCGNCYSAAGSLKLHMRACMKQKETEERHLEARKCKICGKVYNSISYLKEHILRHSGKVPRKCPHCYRKFLDENKLQQHIKSHELDRNTEYLEKRIVKEFNCSFCHKTFTVVFDSRYGKRRYACDECRDKFTNAENLRHHKESLEEKKEYRCDRCGRQFVFEGFLQRHIKNCDGTGKRKRDRVF